MHWKPRLRFLFWTGLLTTVVLLAAYAYMTRPAALRARLVSLFAGLDLHVTRIGGISFSLSDGLSVHDMLIEADEVSPLYAADRAPDAPPVLRVPHARVRVDPWSVLSGDPRIQSIELQSPGISAVWPAWGADRLSGGGALRLRAPDQGPGELPRLSIKAADIAVYVVKDGRLQLHERGLVDGVGAVETIAGAPSYVLRFEQVGGAVAAIGEPSASMAEIKWRGGALEVQLGWIDLETAQSLLPEAWRANLADLALAGRARANRLIVENTGIVEAEFLLDRVRLAAPAESAESVEDSAHYLQIEDIGGALHYRARPAAVAEPASATRGGDITLQIAGSINDAAAELSLRIDGALFKPTTRSGDGESAGLFGLSGLDAENAELNLSIVELDLPTEERNPAFTASERLPGVVRSSLRKYSAEGKINFRLNLQKQAGGELQYEGEIEGAGASCRYRGFPYPVEDMHGFVRFSNDGVVIDGLNGRHGSGRIRADGRLANTSSWTAFELTFSGRNIPTDADLYEALPERYRKLWERTAPIALCDVTTSLRRDQGNAETGSHPTDVKVDARLLAGSLRLRDDERLSDVRGLIHIDSDSVTLDGLQGFMNDALVRLDGQLSLGRDGDARYDLRVEAADAVLERVSEVRDGGGQSVGRINFAGVGDVWGRIGSGNGASRDYTVHVTDGSLSGFDGKPGWGRVEGWFTLRDDEQRIISLKAERDQGTLFVSGALPGQVSLDRPIVLDLKATDADLSRLTPQLVPGRWSHVREALGLAGRGTLEARFYPREQGDGAPRQAADIHVTAERMKPTPVPLDLHGIEARATLHGDGFELHDATARYGANARIQISGAGGWGDDDSWSNISLEAWDVDLSSELIEAFPTPLSSLLTRMSPSGRVHVKLDRMNLRGLEKLAWDIAGELSLKGAELQVGARLSDFQGQLDGSCEVLANGGVRLATNFKIARGMLADRPIERWEGRLLREPASPLIHLADARGRFCDGEVAGFATIDPDASTYELSFTLHDVSLTQFLNKDAGAKDGGRLDGHVFLRGRTDDPAERVGGGEVRIRGASLLSSPVTASVVEASKQQKRAIGPDVEQAEIWFVWEGAELKFNRLDIHSRDLRLIGEGQWNMDTDAISMTLLGATPEDALRLFPLTDLLELAGQELLQYQVSGTRARPRVTVEPLHNLTDPIRNLIKGGAKPARGN